MKNIKDKEISHLFFSVDSRKYDFVVFNAGAFDMTEEEVLNEDLIPLKYKELTPVIKNLKEQAWSCGCNWFFIFQQEGIYLMNVHDEHFWLCKKHTHNFIKMYLDTPAIFKQKNQTKT